MGGRRRREEGRDGGERGGKRDDELKRFVVFGRTELIRSRATGVVLDLGAGTGHSIGYLDLERVEKYIALEPNVLMHPKIL